MVDVKSKRLASPFAVVSARDAPIGLASSNEAIFQLTRRVCRTSLEHLGVGQAMEASHPRQAIVCVFCLSAVVRLATKVRRVYAASRSTLVNHAIVAAGASEPEVV